MAVAIKSTDVYPDEEFVKTMTRAEGLALLDQQARKFLGMSGVEFVRRYRAGEIEHLCRLEVARVAILLPLAEL